MSIKEQLQPLVWSVNDVAKSPSYDYRINQLGGKYIVAYSELKLMGKTREATGFLTLDDAKEWSFNHHCEKMTQWIKPEPLTQTLNWFKAAKPEPTDKDLLTQIGCHYEEVSEMIIACVGYEHVSATYMSMAADGYKTATDDWIDSMQPVNKTELFDALLDQIVTAMGVGYMMGFNMVGGLNEVNASNYSKFVDGKAVTDDNGKIIKGDKYFKPDLTKFMGGRDD